MAELTFVRTVSLAKFKEEAGVQTINVVNNPNTNKKFFTCPEDSSVSGKVAKELDTTKGISMSWCKDEETEFFMLHNTPDTSSNVVESL